MLAVSGKALNQPFLVENSLPMLDVHVPHGRVREVSDFFIHLVTITVGLLIATQIESCVEWRHQVHLAESARESLHAEIEHNVVDLKEAQQGMKKWRTEVDNDLKAMNRIQDHPNDPDAQNAALAINFHAGGLRETAWATAQATGALAYMPYDEAQTYASIYRVQSNYQDAQKLPEQDVANLFGLLNKFNWNGKTKSTADQASQMAENLGKLRMHVIRADLLLQESLERNSAFLENRKPRETFEESGILLARPRGSKTLIDAKRAGEIEAAHRAELCEGKTSFGKVLTDSGILLALDELVPYAHWITPEGVPKRFDTWFFLAAAPPEQVGAHDGKESTDSIWLSPREALAGGESGRFKLPFPTTRNLIRLGKQPGVKAALGDAGGRPIVTVMPVVTKVNGGRQLRIPLEAGYDGELFEINAN